MSFREHVRKRPGMYVGSVRDGSGANHVVFEFVGNAIDQFLIGTLSRLDISLNGHQLVVCDDGPGLPFKSSSPKATLCAAAYYLEEPHFSATAGGHAPHVHVTRKGVGLAAVNALSSQLKVETRDGTTQWVHAYSDGIPLEKPHQSASDLPSGTRFMLTLDPNIFALPDMTALRASLEHQAYLYPGLAITLNGESFLAEGGLSDLAASLWPTGTGPCLWVRETLPEFRIDLALAGRSAQPVVKHSWVNGVATKRGGSHELALKHALEQTNHNPAVQLLHVIMEQPEFAGPTKDKLWTPTLVEPLKMALNRLLQQ